MLLFLTYICSNIYVNRFMLGSMWVAWHIETAAALSLKSNIDDICRCQNHLLKIGQKDLFKQEQYV